MDKVIPFKKLRKLKISPVKVWIYSAPFFIFALFLFRSSSFWQLRILMIAAAAYLATALLHHHKDKTLTLEIMIEYILLAALALIIAQGIFN